MISFKFFRWTVFLYNSITFDNVLKTKYFIFHNRCFCTFVDYYWTLLENGFTWTLLHLRYSNTIIMHPPQRPTHCNKVPYGGFFKNILLQLKHFLNDFNFRELYTPTKKVKQLRRLCVYFYFYSDLELM